MLWPKASPLDLDFGLCAWAKLFNNTEKYRGHVQMHPDKGLYSNLRLTHKQDFSQALNKYSVFN